MNDKQQGSAGGSVLAGWPAPVPSSAQPADASPGPHSAGERDLAMVAGFGLTARLPDEDRQLRKAYRLAEHYGMGPQKLIDYAEAARLIYGEATP